MNEIPRISPRLLGGFRRFVKYYLRRHFHAVAVNRGHLETADIRPSDALVVYANHASWWDPLTAIYLSASLFPQFRMYAPIDSRALDKYRMFGRLGFFGVDQERPRGAVDFLRISQKIASMAGASLWVTPEGRFADVRDTTAELMPGLAHLAEKLAGRRLDRNAAIVGPDAGSQPPRVWFVPVAVEYAFWEERQPELLIWFGRALQVEHEPQLVKSQWRDVLASSLRAAQSELATAAIARDSSRFHVLLGGRSGAFFLYDWWRTLAGFATGRPIQTDHGKKLSHR